MTSIPATTSDRLPENPEKPQTDSSRSGESQNVQYDLPLNNRAQEARLQKKQSKIPFWKKYEEGQKSDWWFASTGIPLLAAAVGPLANVLSIAALVTPWRQTIFIDGDFVSPFLGDPYSDPRWCYWLNLVSLICGFLGNLFLLLNFTQRVRYLIALPASIILWYVSTGLLIGITASMNIYVPPDYPNEIYTQGYWYAIAAAACYLVCSMSLMVNMLGFFFGHYPDTFELTDNQRTLILQTMVFFIWLAGGAAVFSTIEQQSGEPGWAFPDALYFCDVTILTVGFGDLYPTTDVGRGIVFPFAVGGIISLGLVVSSIYKFMRELSEENITKKHIDRMRERTIERTVTSSFDLRQREHDSHHLIRRKDLDKGKRLKISGPTDGHRIEQSTMQQVVTSNPLQNLKRKPRLLLLREEKDRFEAMRRIQHQTRKFKRWWALTVSITAFGVLWCIGAVVFWQTERGAQGMSYFQALYFCYISLLTIGYGDLAPKTNGGRVFFVVWSLVAVPTMTVLVSDMGDTVVAKFKSWFNDLADFTVLPKYGIWRQFLNHHPWLLNWLQNWQARKAEKKRLRRGFEVADPEADPANPNATNDIDETTVTEEDDTTREEENEIDLTTTRAPTLQILGAEADRDASGHIPTPHVLSRGLAASIKRVASDIKLQKPKKYSYEEWVEFTRLIRLSSRVHGEEIVEDEELIEEEGLVEWDWIGEDSPMVSGLSESEWVLDRLCEALVRCERRRCQSDHGCGHLGCKLTRVNSHDHREGEGVRRVAKGELGKDEHGLTRDGTGTHNQVLMASGANGSRVETDERLFYGYS